MPRGREYSQLKRTGERLSRGPAARISRFSPLPDSAVDFGDYPVAPKLVVSMDWESEILKRSSK